MIQKTSIQGVEPLPRGEVRLYVADLHLGANRFPGQDDDTLRRLDTVVEKFGVWYVVYLGDIFHHYDPPASLIRKFLDHVHLDDRFLWGNHEVDSRGNNHLKEILRLDECYTQAGIDWADRQQLVELAQDFPRPTCTHLLPDEARQIPGLDKAGLTIIAGGYHHPHEMRIGNSRIIWTGAMTKTSVSDGQCSCLLHDDKGLWRLLLPTPSLPQRRTHSPNLSCSQPPQPHRTTLLEYVRETCGDKLADTLARIAPESAQITLFRWQKR